jgi:hypothetical protein
MASGKKRIKVDPPPAKEDLDFSGTLDMGQQWDTHSGWIQKGRVPKLSAKSNGGRFHIADTEGILEGYDLQAWLDSGMPF